uniref:Saposin B-type domain-containing protein n=1 Tax=Plectus sambesii TaxID=2011161 RepID=A0A914WH28_9BILA
MNFLFVIGCWLSLFVVDTVIAAPSVREADIMSCALCTLVTETVPVNAEPAAFFQVMFSRCARMGLMAPACEQLIDDHAKRIFLLVRSGVEPKNVCTKLRMCR